MKNHLESLLYYELLIFKLNGLRDIKFTTITRWGFENYFTENRNLDNTPICDLEII